MNWLFKFFKGGKTISQAIKEFFEMNGRMPNARETLKMKDIFRQSQSNVIQFPKDRITDWWKPRPGKGEVVSLDKDPLKGMRDRIRPGSLLDDLAKKDPNAAATHIRNMDITDQHMNKITTGKINYKEMEKLLGVKLKGDETWSELKNIQKKKFPEPDDLASGGVAGQLHLNEGGRTGYFAAGVVGKFFKWAKPLAKRDIRVKMKTDMDWSYEGPESGWEGGTWLDLDFVPLTKKGTKILDDLAKNKKIGKSTHGKETSYYTAGNSEDGLMAVEDMKKMKGDMELETVVHDKVKDSVKGKYETTKVYGGKDIDSKKILDETADLATDSPYHDNVFQDEFTEEIINTIKKEKMASGGIAGELHLNRPGYAGGKRTLPKQLSLFERPKIGDALKKLSDAELKKQMREMKRRWGVSVPKASGGLAHVLGV